MMAEKAEAARLHVHSLQIEHEKMGALTGEATVQLAPRRKRKADYSEEEWEARKQAKRQNQEARAAHDERVDYLEKMFAVLKDFAIERVGHSGFVALELKGLGQPSEVCDECVVD